MKLLGLYENILNYFGLVPDKSGFIRYAIDDKNDPVLVDDKHLVMPLQEHLRNFNPKEKMIFHPFAENVMRGESAVIKKLRSCINIKLNYTIGIIIKSLLNIVASPALHAKLNNEQMALLTVIKDADEKTVINFVSLMNAGIKSRADRLFTNVYMMRGGTYTGKRFSKVGVVSFPFYEELIKSEKHDKLRVKDREALIAVFKFIFPNIDETEAYNHGSNERAPFFDALLRSSANIAARLNDILFIFDEFIEDANSFVFESQWVEHINDMAKFEPEIRRIPVQDGNEGSIFNEVEIPEPEQPVQTQTVTRPVVNNQVQQNGMWNQAPMQQKPEIAKTNRGIDFKSLVNANPAVAYSQNALPPNVMMQQMMRNGQMPMGYPNQMQMPMQNQVPTWAAPQQSMMPNMGNGSMMIQTANGPLQVTMMQMPNGPVYVAMTPNGPMQVIMQPNGAVAFAPMNMGAPMQGYNI